MAHRFTQFQQLENGNLRITLTPEGREELDGIVEQMGENELNPDIAFTNLIEFQLCNGWAMIAPETCGALTSAPMVACDFELDESGQAIPIGSVWAYMDYQVYSPALELYRHGFINLVGAAVEAA